MDFQKQAIAFITKRKRALLALAPGLGKTLCAVMGAEQIKASRILVISPLTLMRNWRAEIKKWSGNNSAIWYKDPAKWERPEKWVITNYDTAIRHIMLLRDCAFDVIVVDESVLVKNRKAKRSNKVDMITDGVENVWLLSGSPTTKFYDDLYQQLYILNHRRFPSYWRFAETYCVIERNQWGTAIINNVRNADILLKHDLEDIYFARTQGQVLDLPDWIFDNYEVPMSDLQYKLYLEMELIFKATLPEGDEILAPNVLAQLIRLVQFASNPMLVGGPDISTKWDSVSELLEYENKPALIWTSFKRTAEYMQDKLSKHYRVRALTGDTKERYSR
jgi:superfamily II DNA or RNA helicase